MALKTSTFLTLVGKGFYTKGKCVCDLDLKLVALITKTDILLVMSNLPTKFDHTEFMCSLDNSQKSD